MRIALFEPDIPQNTGNILRTSACLGIDVEIIGPTGFIIDDKRFRRAAMDYINYVNYTIHIDWKSFYNWSLDNNYRLILLTTKSKNNYTKYNFQDDDILIFGKESAGVPNFVHECVNKKITIPIKEKLRSMNVSSAVAMVVGEAQRQLKS